MARELKFRGQSLNGDWHIGNLTILKNDTSTQIAGHYISNSAGLPFAYKIRPETVGQYVGLNDTLDVEIYEGDIIAGDVFTVRENRHSIKYDNNLSAFQAVFIPHNQTNDGCSITQKWITDYRKTVIGNIHSNPNLLNPQQ